MSRTAVIGQAPRPSVAATAAGSRLKIEHVLIACGLTIAVASCGFAAVMMAANTGRPIVHNGEYFSVFAKMDRTLRARAAASAVLGVRPDPIKGDIDPIVTGSIGAPRKSDRATAPLPGFSVREAFDGTALLDTPSGVQVVRVGSLLVGGGRVKAIERRGGRIVVATERGVVSGEAD